MSFFDWKKLDLFQLDLVNDYKHLKAIKAKFTTNCYNDRQRVFCDDEGWAHIFNKNWDIVSFRTQMNNVKLCAITCITNTLVILSQYKETHKITLKIYNIQNITKRGGAICTGHALLTPTSSATVLRVIDVNNLLYIAIGNEKGQVLIFRGTVSMDMSTRFRDINITTGPITGIEFKQNDAFYYMFVCGNAGVFCYSISDNNAVQGTKNVLDVSSFPSSCSAMNNDFQCEYYLLIGREDAVYCFNADGRGPCYAIEGEKKHLLWKDNLLIIVQQTTDDESSIIIIDILNKLIVFHRKIDSVSCVLYERNYFLIITDSKETFVLQSLNLQCKINVLVTKNLYDIALRLLDDSEHNDRDTGFIYTHYGDFLLARQDVEEAISKYIKTIGIIEPYAIIKKLLNPKYTKYLIKYLAVLVETDFATNEHLKLLKTCRERSNICSKMQEICSKKSHELDDGINSVISDTISLSTARSNVSRFLHTIHEAEKASQFLLNEENQIYELCMENSELLMTIYPQQMVDILILICTKNDANHESMVPMAHRFIPMFMPNANYCRMFLEKIVKKKVDYSKTLYGTLVEMYMREWRLTKKYSNKIIEFITKNKGNLSPEHIFILCKKYLFWIGIKYYNQYYFQQHFSVQEFVECYEQGYNSTVQSSGDLSSYIWIQALIQLEKINRDSDHIQNFLLNSMILKSVSLIQGIQSVYLTENILSRHLKTLLTQDQLQKMCEKKTKSELVADLICDITTANNLLLNLLDNAIEFRNTFCNFCRQKLHFPAVHFLCLHSFHRDCLSDHSESKVCLTCSSPKSQNTSVELNKFDNTCNIIQLISGILRSGIHISYKKYGFG